MKIEMIEPAIREHFEMLQAEIAKAMFVPEHLLRHSPMEAANLQRRAYAATETMRRQALRLYLEHCHPRAVVIPEQEKHNV